MDLPEFAPAKHTFDKKYKVVVSIKSTPYYMEMLDWVNTNSTGSVDVWFNDTGEGIVIDVAFENTDDAIFFKIKYQ